MSDSHSPFICVTCRRSFPDDLKAEDAPRYFAQDALLPRSDADLNFRDEADSILEFISVVAVLARYGDAELDDAQVKTLHALFLELSEEAQRRLALTAYAIHERDTRTDVSVPARAPKPAKQTRAA